MCLEKISGLSVLLLFAASPTWAQPDATDSGSCLLAGENGESTKDCISKDQLLGALDLAAPTNSLFTLIGSTPENVITPKTGDDWALSILPQAVNAFGDEQFGFAMEVNPGLLMIPETISPAQLSPARGEPRSPFETAKILSLFTFTTAISRTAGDVDKTQYGFGMNFNYDTKSPLVNNGEYRDCVSESQDLIDQTAADFGSVDIELRKLLSAARVPDDTISPLVEILIPLDADEDLVKAALETAGIKNASTVSLLVPGILRTKEIFAPARIDAFDKLLTQCVARVSKWNRDVYALGAAIYHTDSALPQVPPGGMPPPQDLEDVTGYGVWGTLAFESPLRRDGESNGQFTFHGRYTHDLVRDRGSGANAVTERLDSWSVASRYTHQFAGTNDQSRPKARAFRGFIEAAYVEEKFSGMEDEFWQAGIGAEIQIRKDMFLQFVVGDTFGSDIDRSTYLSGQFKWSLSKLPAQ